jgi:hypothetical protein
MARLYSWTTHLAVRYVKGITGLEVWTSKG